MEDTTLHITRTFDAPLARVWQAFTDVELIKKWWGPAYFSAPSIAIDFREGGKYLYCMRGAMGPGMPEQDFWSAGIYKEIVPMKKIVCTDHFADAEGNYISPNTVGMPGEWPDEMLVTFEFEEAEGKTVLHVTHVGHPIEMKQNATMGWKQSLDKMEAAL
jgi:uncharacterized protein YndB with AHSA1/START domain